MLGRPVAWLAAPKAGSLPAGGAGRGGAGDWLTCSSSSCRHLPLTNAAAFSLCSDQLWLYIPSRAGERPGAEAMLSPSASSHVGSSAVAPAAGAAGAEAAAEPKDDAGGGAAAAEAAAAAAGRTAVEALACLRCAGEESGIATRLDGLALPEMAGRPEGDARGMAFDGALAWLMGTLEAALAAAADDAEEEEEEAGGWEGAMAVASSTDAVGALLGGARSGDSGSLPTMRGTTIFTALGGGDNTALPERGRLACEPVLAKLPSPRSAARARLRAARSSLRCRFS